MQIALIIISILVFVVSITWMYFDPGFEPLVGLLLAAATFIEYLRRREPEKRQTGEILTLHRNNLINHVEKNWVNATLAVSPHGLAMLELGKVKDSGAVQPPGEVRRPWAVTHENTGAVIAAGMNMWDIFQTVGDGWSLLILGEPGAGKTTMLVELAQILIEKARTDKEYPIPLVFNLSGWSSKRKGRFGLLSRFLDRRTQQTFLDWLNGQLRRRYSMPYIRPENLFLLLDGLDEIAEEDRASCVAAINEFSKKYPNVPRVICSRIQDYEAIGKKLDLHGAIRLQALDRSQIDNYLEEAGEALAGVRQAIANDPTLYDLLQTPLMLSVLALAYKNASPSDLPQFSEIANEESRIKAQREHLFDTYIDHMFKRRGHKEQTPFGENNVRKWLSFLAYHMKRQDEITYSQDLLQPSWINQPPLATIFNGISVLPFAAAIGLLLAVRISPSVGLVVGVVICVVYIMLLLVRGPYIDIYVIDTNSALTWTVLGLAAGLLLFVINAIPSIIMSGVFVFLITSLIFGFSSFEEEKDLQDDIWDVILDAIGTALVIGVPVGLLYSLGRWLSLLLFETTHFAAVVTGIGFGLLAALFTSWDTAESDEEDLDPLGSGILFGLMVGAVLFLSSGWLSGLMVGLVAGPLLALIGGIAYTLRYLNPDELLDNLSELQGVGIFSYILHMLLRVIMSSRVLPLRLNQFLNYAASLVFIKKVGDGYQFIHLLLRDHLADKYEADFVSTSGDYESGELLTNLTPTDV